MDIELYLNEFIELWNNTEKSFPELKNEVSVAQKIQREEGIIQFTKQLKTEVDWKNMNIASKEKFANQFNTSIAYFFKNSFGFTSEETSIITQTGFSAVSKKFMSMARSFDPEVKIEDVYQASRNLWIINSLQIMMGVDVSVTSSMFAYSMLYPYSDNYLDDKTVSTSEKVAFSRRFRQRLEGEKVIPANDHERKIFDLVGMIEIDWDRGEYPKVFESLLAIHDAQTKSILLLNNDLNYDQLLSICIEKGGTSVLADGYLINGELTDEQEWFCFGFGTFLQFIDDIQDLQEDKSGSVETLFTYASNCGLLNEFTNRTISFSKSVMDKLDCFPVADLSHMNGLMTKSFIFLLTESVGLNDKYFTKEYVTQFEKYSPFRYSFVKKRRNNLSANRVSIMKKMDSLMFQNQDVAMQA